MLSGLVLLAVAGMSRGTTQFDSVAAHTSPSAPDLAGSHGDRVVPLREAGTPAIAPGGSASTDPGISLGIGVAPGKICAQLQATCPAAAGLARVTLTANAATSGPESWRAVQVAFVLETTVYDGTADATAGDPGKDPCMPTTQLVCEESNGVPFFVANAQLIASEIQTANPHSAVSFALVDYFATLTDHDDGDGSEYHVDIQNFVAASVFGAAVSSTFQAEVLAGGWVYADSDLSDNILDSSSITALYGTIIGSDLSWTNDTHHVIVWMGTTAPRDPSYLVDYGVSAGDGPIGSPSWSSSCEPSYPFSTGASPDCEGWVRSQDGNPADSIAALARNATTCTDSVGGVCTVDTIDYWSTPTDYDSSGWPTGPVGGGPGGYRVIEDVDHIIAAGCDMAAATGGTWDGPAGISCADGQAGDLEYVAHGYPNGPNLNNPTLLKALSRIGFGPVVARQVAAGTSEPMFQFVPFGHIAIPPADRLQATAACFHQQLPQRTCQIAPTLEHSGSMVYLGWNWSTAVRSNIMQLGDSWTASFNVYATGPPYALVPVDACTTTACHYGGSAESNGQGTSMVYVPASNHSVVRVSFPLGRVLVEPAPNGGLPGSAPTSASPGPGIPVASGNGVPVVQAVASGNPIGIATGSLQAITAGLLGAGFVRAGIRQKAVALRLRMRSAVIRSRAGGNASRDRPRGPGSFV
ncbi:MAG: hypothetical protein L3K08_06560 [Thermoplasmata archaeon]|nr:hypothetical protein [Thermoplasmata archaeon]